MRNRGCISRHFCRLVPLGRGGVFPENNGSCFRTSVAPGKNLLMTHPTADALVQAISFPAELESLRPLCLAFLQRLLPLLTPFCAQLPCPQTTHQLEIDLFEQLRLFGRDLLQQVFHQFESADPQQQPARLHYAGNWYRRRRQHPNDIATLFGKIRLQRYLYEACEPGEPAIHPLELYLGLEEGNATPALAERVGKWAAEHPQEAVLQLLWDEHDVHWSCDTLRKVTSGLADGLASHRQQAQTQKLLQWLQAANDSRGAHRPVLAVGRDGIHLPMRGEYKEGATATVSVYDRRGKRLGTVYLGHMPQEGQLTLSAQLTALVLAVLQGWTGPLPRLAYITDGGHHPKDYYQRVLRRMKNPHRPGERLAWQWIVDYYHASGYVTKLAEALFGETSAGTKWARRMRHWLKHRRQGVVQVLRSATAHHNQRLLSKAAQTEYGKAYRYLRRHARFMNYEQYRRQGMPIGSGVTEAACKTVFTQRFKQSGMSWNITSGQVIVELRVILRSRLWSEVNQTFRVAKKLPTTTTCQVETSESSEKAA